MFALSPRIALPRPLRFLLAGIFAASLTIVDGPARAQSVSNTNSQASPPAWSHNVSSALNVRRPGNFTVIGPGGGGSFYNPTISPTDPNTVLVSCDMTGAYITHDGGRSWRMFNLRGPVDFFAFDPQSPQTIYTGTTVYGPGLWRSIDDGRTWNLLYPKASDITSVNTNNDTAGVAVQSTPDPFKTITALAVDPSDSHTLYVAADTAGESDLWVSRDWGKTWQKQAVLPETVVHLWVDPHSSRSARKLVLTGAEFAVIVTGSDVSTVELPGSLDNRDSSYVWLDQKFTSAGFTNTDKLVLYVLDSTAGYVSTDGGKTWRDFILPGTGAKLAAIATGFAHPETAYISFQNMQVNGKTERGVMKTVDAGSTWNILWVNPPTPQSVHDDWINDVFGFGWGGNPFMLGVDDQNPNQVYATDSGRVFETTDGGANWYAKYSRSVPGGGWTTTGLDATSTYGIFFDPFDHNHQFIAYTDIGLFSSNDGGKSWTSAVQNGVPSKWVNTTYWMTFDPQVKGRIWIANSYDHDLPRPKMWSSVPRFDGGVLRSDDGGQTWVQSTSGMPPTAATDIVLDPTSPVDARVLYATGFGRGVFKSVDGGKTWTLKNNGITQTNPFAWRIVRDPDGVLYLLVVRSTTSANIGTTHDGAIYKSTDGANTWTPVTLPQGVNDPNGLAIDPRDPQRLYLAAWPRAVPHTTSGEGGGVYLSTDGGQTWQQVFDREQHMYDVTIDPRNPDTVYAAGYGSTAWISRDRGMHWRLIAGANFHWMQRVMPDPNESGWVYIPTFGGGLWHGSVHGGGPTDIVSPAILQPGR